MILDRDVEIVVKKFSERSAKLDYHGQLLRSIKEQLNPESEIAKTPLEDVFKDALKELPMLKSVIDEAQEYRDDLISRGYKQSEAMIKAVYYVVNRFKQIEEEYKERLNEVVRQRVVIVKSPFVFNQETGKYETVDVDR